MVKDTWNKYNTIKSVINMTNNQDLTNIYYMTTTGQVLGQERLLKNEICV